MRSALTYLSVILAFTVVVASGCRSDQHPGESEPAREFPNILWLVAEDLGPYIPPFGDSTIQTPHLSRLAEEGVRYINVYSVSGVCSPSRAALATGMYPTRIGAHHMQIGNVPREFANNPMMLDFVRRYMPKGLDPYEVVPPPEVKLHSEFLREIGYYCTNNAKEDYQFKPSSFSWDESSPAAHWRNRAEGQPFFAIFNFMVTHESRIWLKAADSLWVDSLLQVPVPPYLPQNEVAGRDVRRMYSNIAEMDQRVGEILEQLEEDGELENTVIFWYSDHGGPLPRQKRLLYDSGLEVPLIIRFPGAEYAGEVDDRLISFVDFLPTILSLAHIEPPEYLDGQAFLGPYRSTEDRKYIHAAADRFDENADMIRAVRDKRFKYLRNYHPESGYYLPLSFREQMAVMQELLRLREADQLNETQRLWFRESKPEEELFDCVNDPEELVNLAGAPEYAQVLAELRKECDRWMKEVDDKGFINEQEMVNQFWPGGKQPITPNPLISVEQGMISIGTEMEGSRIGYQIVNSTDSPSGHWEIFGEPIQLEDDQRLYAIAHRKGYLPSDTVIYE